jgi:lycopene beta-cyclase
VYPTSQRILIAGSGLAGLSLASSLAGGDNEITLIDQQRKNTNDRTWCFWTTQPHKYQSQLTHSWSKIRVASSTKDLVLDIAPYTYCMIRSQDWYKSQWDLLNESPNISMLLDTVESINPQSGIVQTSNQQLRGDLIFSSIINKQDVELDNRHTLLQQHFVGWWIETEEDSFDPEIATFMDFRTEQHNQTRFVYVLPISKTRALIEYTVFSAALLQGEEYEEALDNYIRDVLKITKFAIVETEKGAIPMTDLPFTPLRDNHLIKIGTAGGFVKPSAGFAFTRTQKAVGIISDLITRGKELLPRLYRTPFRYRLYDSVVLKALATGKLKGEQFFTQLFEHAPAGLVLRFLDENTSIQEDIAIMKHFLGLSGTFFDRLWNARKI